MQTINKWTIYTFCCIVLCSCQFKCNLGKTKDAPKENKTTSNPETNKDGTLVTNNISVTTKGFKVKKAILLYPDNTPVPDDNTINLNEKIKIALYIDEGWNLTNGRAFVGAAEKISTDAGVTVAETDDLFAADSGTGFTAEEAELITLSAIITNAGRGINYYVVTFRVWDKNGDSEIKGHYNFYLKH